MPTRTKPSPPGIDRRRSHPTGSPRTLSLVAAVGWLAVGGYGLWEILEENTSDDWESPYLMMAVSLVVAVACSIGAVWQVADRSARSKRRTAGFAVCGLGLLFAVLVAWAAPLWMFLLAIGFGLLASSGAAERRRPLVLLAVGQVLGIVALFAADLIEMGRKDEYGDHPAAFGLGLIVTVLVVIAGLVDLNRPASSPARLAPVGPSFRTA